MSKPNVLIYAPREEPKDILDRLTSAGVDISYGEKAWQMPRTDFEADFATATRDKVALMGTSIRHTPITRAVMAEAQRLRVIAKYTVGVDDIDTDAATDLGIMVCHAPTESNCFGVAETTMAMMLAMLKRVVQRDREVREGKWREPHMATTFLGAREDGYSGITIGLVGLGRIATRVSQLLAPWRVKVIAYDPYAEPSRFQLTGVRRVDYETLLRVSDVVSFHVVLTKETRFMLREEQIKLMKPSAIIINTARGKVIDEAAVAKAIAEGRLRGAAIDAFEEEPLGMDSPLRQLGDKVLMSPHSASFNEGGELAPGIQWALRSVLCALRGEVPDNVYNKEVIPRWREKFGGASLIG